MLYFVNLGLFVTKKRVEMEQRCEIEYNAADGDIISQVRKSLNGTTKEKSKVENQEF